MTHVFISYVRENQQQVDRVCTALRSRGIDVWLDREQLRPGYRWQRAIRDAIRDGAFYVACFSPEYATRSRTYMNEELTIAIDELRVRGTDRAWFIPVRLSECPIPDRSIGGGETLRDIQWVDLFPDFKHGLAKLIQVIQPHTVDLVSKSEKSDQVSILSPEEQELQNETITFRFENGTELAKTPMLSVLEAYYQDNLSGRLAEFRFANSQISIERDPVYEGLRSRLEAAENVGPKRMVRRLEQALIDGCRIILDDAYLKDKQTLYTYAACYWFARAVRSWIIYFLRFLAQPDSLEEASYGRVAIESPLFGVVHDIEQFYDFELIKLDFWHPEKKDAPHFSLFLRVEGYAGKWFNEHLQPAEPYSHHYSPNDFYNFILPQMVLRHVLLREPLIKDWSGYWVGAA